MGRLSILLLILIFGCSERYERTYVRNLITTNQWDVAYNKYTGEEVRCPNAPHQVVVWQKKDWSTHAYSITKEVYDSLAIEDIIEPSFIKKLEVMDRKFFDEENEFWEEHARTKPTHFPRKTPKVHR